MMNNHGLTLHQAFIVAGIPGGLWAWNAMSPEEQAEEEAAQNGPQQPQNQAGDSSDDEAAGGGGFHHGAADFDGGGGDDGGDGDGDGGGGGGGGGVGGEGDDEFIPGAPAALLAWRQQQRDILMKELCGEHHLRIPDSWDGRRDLNFTLHLSKYPFPDGVGVPLDDDSLRGLSAGDQFMWRAPPEYVQAVERAVEERARADGSISSRGHIGASTSGGGVGGSSFRAAVIANSSSAGAGGGSSSAAAGGGSSAGDGGGSSSGGGGGGGGANLRSGRRDFARQAQFAADYQQNASDYERQRDESMAATRAGVAAAMAAAEARFTPGSVLGPPQPQPQPQPPPPPPQPPQPPPQAEAPAPASLADRMLAEVPTRMSGGPSAPQPPLSASDAHPEAAHPEAVDYDAVDLAIHAALQYAPPPSASGGGGADAGAFGAGSDSGRATPCISVDELYEDQDD